MNHPAGKLLKFIHKSFSVGPEDEWKEKDYGKLLTKTASHETYAETVPSWDLPDADSLHLKIKERNIQELHRSLLGSRELPGIEEPAILILDPTPEPWYGEGWGPWIHEYKSDPGSRGSWKYLTASILAGWRYFLDSKILNKFSVMENEVAGTLDRSLDLLEVEVVLLDRGLTTSKVLKELKERGLNYLGLCPKYETVKSVIQEAEDEGRDLLIREGFELKDQETTLAVVKDENRDFWWTWVTNLGLVEASGYIRLYRKRWNIETGFRVHDEARIKSKSKKPEIRYFYFLCSLLLYNGWKALNYEIQFKRCLILIADGQTDLGSIESCGASVDDVEKPDSIH